MSLILNDWYRMLQRAGPRGRRPRFFKALHTTDRARAQSGGAWRGLACCARRFAVSLVGAMDRARGFVCLYCCDGNRLGVM